MDRKSYETFLKNTDFKEAAIFGLSSRAKACFNWFAEYYPAVNIVAFIPDSKTDLQEFCGKSVLSFDYIKDHPEMVIIYAERDISEIESLKKKNELKNTFFIFYYVKPYLDTRNISYSEKEVRVLYQPNDLETQLFLDNFFLAKSYDWCMLLPIDALDWVAKYNKRYWDTTDNDLSAYDELTFLDCGAYTGDSLEDFYRQYSKSFRSAYVLEADKTKQTALENTVSALGIAGSTKIIMQGVSDEAGDYFVENAGTTSGRVVSTGEQEAQTVRIDDLNIQPIGRLCIKMDIEGLEMSALKGAAETIKRYTPEMAICIYHQTADIFEIPAYIKSLCPTYKFIIRGGVHTVCYCSTERF